MYSIIYSAYQERITPWNCSKRTVQNILWHFMITDLIHKIRRHVCRMCVKLVLDVCLWRLRTTPGQSWFTRTFKVPATKPCWKLNSTCQDPAGLFGYWALQQPIFNQSFSGYWSNISCPVAVLQLLSIKFTYGN